MGVIDMYGKIGSAESSSYYNCGDGAVMYMAENVTRQEFSDYAKKLCDNGFCVFQQTEMAENIHFTLKKDGVTVQYYYVPSEKCARLIEDSYTCDFSSQHSDYERVCETQLFQFETDHSLIDCGMCYIIRCADNSFFVIDSAHMYSVHDNDRIHALLRSMTPGGEKIRISGWFVSHGHEDHINKFKDYLLYNMSDTVIECIYMNMIDINHRDSHFWMDAGIRMRADFQQVVADSGIPVVKLHTGQSFCVRNLRFEVLCTHEDIFPASCRDFNNTSTVLMMYAEGNRVFFPGDASDESDKVLRRRYGKYLECDILQLSHHGHNGLSPEAYRFTNADVVLCPNTEIKINEEMPRFEANRVAKDIAREFYISSNGTVRLTLPYKPGTAFVFDDETTENFDGIKELWNYDYTDEFKIRHNEEFVKRGGKL